MKQFASLYTALDETTKTTRKIQALKKYFASAAPADAAWAVYFLIGRKPRQVVRSSNLREWAALEAGVPDWLFRESYDAVGDVAETIALLLPPPEHSSDLPLAHWIEHRLLPLRGMAVDEQRSALLAAWRELDQSQRFIWNKLISGAFRVGVSQQLVTRALALVSGLLAPTISHRLMGDWEPSASFFTALVARDEAGPAVSQPYPFFLAHAIDQPVEDLGDRSEWQAEWKWDGIRCQIIRRSGQTFIWSRGEELVTDRYPELSAMGAALPEGTVLDGEILPFLDDRVLPFAMLQRRIGRKSVTRAILSQVPVVMMVYDLLECDGQDVRNWPLERRRDALASLVEGVHAQSATVAAQLRLSPIVATATWDELTGTWLTSRDAFAEGLMLKRLDSAYGVGRPRGSWWKWKIAPLTIDAVLIAAQRGSGKRASLYTDYTFGIWNNGELVPIAKAYSGLTDQEIREVDGFIRANMLEKFGPVRTVKPELVFELAFEGLNRSSRHKSGIAVRFPRILRRRFDKPAAEADTLETVRALLPGEGAAAVSKDKKSNEQ